MQTTWEIQANGKMEREKKKNQGNTLIGENTTASELEPKLDAKQLPLQGAWTLLIFTFQINRE